ncbi:hypothetical protein [Methylobacterium sp.]|uniref:hypothetical protein n=1 Tax=Methylobacterium sp. TaxID=409 RepID=UPI003AFF6B2B
MAYDSDYHLTHSSHPQNSAVFFTYENGGFLVPTTLELSGRDATDQFVFPFLLTELGKERFAFKDPSTGLHLCALPSGHRAISIDRSIVDIWETYSLLAAEEKIAAHHPAQAFLVTHRLENLLKGLASKTF